MSCLGLAVAPQLVLEGGHQKRDLGWVNLEQATGTRWLHPAGPRLSRSRARVRAQRDDRDGEEVEEEGRKQNGSILLMSSTLNCSSRASSASKEPRPGLSGAQARPSSHRGHCRWESRGRTGSERIVSLCIWSCFLRRNTWCYADTYTFVGPENGAE